VNLQTISIGGNRRLVYAELGAGPPLLYLHDFLDIHGDAADWLPFHHALAKHYRVIAPAFAGCHGSDEDEDALSYDDVLFDVLDAADALGLGSVPVIGTGIGGWIAAELAVRNRRFVERLVLLGATGLFVPGVPIADVFFTVQPRNGGDMSEFRHVFFADGESALAKEWIPDGRMSIERELLRYAMFRFAARIGFRPPYLYDRRLVERLPRYAQPALVLWGAADALVPLAHAHAYGAGLPGARVRVLDGCGHALHIERPEAAADEIIGFLREESVVPV
jgi:pimeloyl-ACP methyl ester carboxylesterase